MIIINDKISLTYAINCRIEANLKNLLIQRCNQIGGDIKDQARFIVVEPGDSVQAFENELGFAGLSDPAGSFGCEWVAEYATFREAVWILTDDGYPSRRCGSRGGKDEGQSHPLMPLTPAWAS